MNVVVACHIHSEWSYDGSWSLKALASEFGRRGYRVLMMTEHDRGFTQRKWQEYREKCAAASTSEILVLPGIEYSDAANLIHVLTWGNIPFLGENLPTGVMLEAITKSGGVAVMAHPSRKDAWQSFDPAWADSLSGIEIWNRKTDGWQPSSRAAQLIGETGTLPFAGLDFHSQRQFFPLAMHLDVKGVPTEDSLLESIKNRRCRPYAFTIGLDRLPAKAIVGTLAPFEAARRAVRWIYRKYKGRPRQKPS